ncbi:MAG: MGDG synthase family glycosyltransferase [Terriglobia bacterium]
MPKILILTISHGAAHRRAAEALQAAFAELRPELRVELIDTLQYCTRWFRAYYDSYALPMRYWPSLWNRIEDYQHRQTSTSPGWLYEHGGRPLFRYLEAQRPEVVIATEVGVGEMAALYKRRSRARFFLVALELMDFNRAWVQPEFDLYPVVHADLGSELEAAGAPRERIATCGMPIHPVYAQLPERASARERLGLRADLALLLVMFGGTGFGHPKRIMAVIEKVHAPFQAAFISGRNEALEQELRQRVDGLPNARVLGWVDNMHEWMVASDLLLSKPGGATLMEAAACELPLLVFDPLPGNERRTCQWIEKWKAGVWLRTPDEAAPVLERLLQNPEERELLRQRARTLSHPRAAFDTAAEILKRCAL